MAASDQRESLDVAMRLHDSPVPSTTRLACGLGMDEDPSENTPSPFAVSVRLDLRRDRVVEDVARLLPESGHDVRRWTPTPSNVRLLGAARLGAREAFQRGFAACALKRGWLRLWFLEPDGRLVAAWHGFRSCGVESYYQAGGDPAWARDSDGFVLLSHSIRQTLEDGLEECRVLRGDDKFKYCFTNDDLGARDSRCLRKCFRSHRAGRRQRDSTIEWLPAALRRPLDL
jgi:Acetyltransferase (GNAT) domain